MSGINCIDIFQYPYWLVIPSNQPSSFYWVAPSQSSIIEYFSQEIGKSLAQYNPLCFLLDNHFFFLHYIKPVVFHLSITAEWSLNASTAKKCLNTNAI